MMNKRRIILALTCLFFVCASPALVKAAIIWDWNFASESGQFVTDGTLVAGSAPPGTYTMSDFTVTVSGFGAPLGSVSGGPWDVPTGLSTPYTLSWDGSVVPQWYG